MIKIKYKGVKVGRHRLLSFIHWLIIVIFIFNIICFNIVDDYQNIEEVDSIPAINQMYITTQPTRSRADTDGDGLPDDKEVIFLTDPNDPDSDDDGVLDGQEGLDTAKNPLHEDNDPDGDGFNNAVDADSDGDGILDGTEVGLTEADVNITATDQTHSHFFPDHDPSTTTDPTKWDTDGDTLSDGDEDRNANGKYEPEQNETDPNFKDYDDDGLHDDTDDLDDDGDGMPDAFEKLYPNALNPLDPTDADEDFDNDGFTNLREYLGNDDTPGNDDWSDPEHPGSMPNIAPVVRFKSDEYVTIGTEKVPRISVEAKQKIIFNDTLLRVADEHANKGLDYIWDWGDGSDHVTIYGVVPNDKPMAHTYDTPGVYTIILQVKDDIGHIGEGKINVDVTHPIGGSEIVLDISRDKDELRDKKTLQRQGWIAYKIIDVRPGDKITIDFTVEQKSEIPGFGVRVFVLPAKDFDTYKRNDPNTKVISRKYEEYWSGPVNLPSASKKITIEPKAKDTIYVIFDNKYYDEGEKHITFDEPVEFQVSVERTESFMLFGENWIFTIAISAATVIICVTLIILALYTKKRRERLLEHKTREEIFSYIQSHPGIHYRGVMNELNLNSGVLTHHLHMLEQQEFIKSYQDGMYRRIYPVNIKMELGGQLTEVQKRILTIIRNTPGISQTEIAKRLKQNRKMIFYHIKRLSNEGLIHVEPAGRESKCFYFDDLKFNPPSRKHDRQAG